MLKTVFSNLECGRLHTFCFHIGHILYSAKNTRFFIQLTGQIIVVQISHPISISRFKLQPPSCLVDVVRQHPVARGKEYEKSTRRKFMNI